MEKIKNWALAAVVVGLLVLAGVVSQKSTAPSVDEVAAALSSKLGALVGPDIPYDHLCVGGVCTYQTSVAMKTATSTICAIQNPAHATATLVFFSAQVTTGYTGTNTFDLGTSTISSGTSSPALVLAHSVASLAKDTLTWGNNSTTTGATYGVNRLLAGNDADGNSYAWIGPNAWLNYKIATGTIGTGGYTGTCKASFRSAN